MAPWNGLFERLRPKAYGRRQPLILINGLAEQHESWFRNRRYWSRYFDLYLPNILVYDGRTGTVKMAREWNTGRNYGGLVVRDLDGDDYPEVVILADVLREHVGVLKNAGGKSLEPLWDTFYEQNYPEDHVSLRVLTESVDDFDGDGRFEIAYAVCDDRNDKGWRTLIVDALTGKPRRDVVQTGHRVAAASGQAGVEWCRDAVLRVVGRCSQQVVRDGEAVVPTPCVCDLDRAASHDLLLDCDTHRPVRRAHPR